MTSLSARRNASVGNSPLSGMPPANEITPSRTAPGAAARARSPSLSTIRALRDSSADQFSGCAGGSVGAVAPSGGPATNVPCPTCARAQPAATSSSYASATVARLTPSDCASSRVAGSFTPGASSRPAINRSRCAWICRASGTALSRSRGICTPPPYPAIFVGVGIGSDEAHTVDRFEHLARPPVRHGPHRRESLAGPGFQRGPAPLGVVGLADLVILAADDQHLALRQGVHADVVIRIG